MSRSVRHRALQRAARAWTSGRPHRALEILADAGLSDQERRTFVREALSRARQRTVALLP